jgi:hypothetical protein
MDKQDRIGDQPPERFILSILFIHVEFFPDPLRARKARLYGTCTEYVDAAILFSTPS